MGKQKLKQGKTEHRKREHKKLGRLQKDVLLRCVFPMLLMGGIMIAMAVRGYHASLVKELENSMRSAAVSVIMIYDELYPGDYELVGNKKVSLYKGKEELTGHYGIIDRMKQTTGYEVSLFYGNTRILTTLADLDGRRFIATGINNTLYSRIETNGGLFIKMDITGQKYYTCYYPLYNSDGTMAGMLALAKGEAEFGRENRGRMLPLYLCAAVCMFLVTVISLNYSNRLIEDILAIKKFMQGMIKGELHNEMRRDAVKREDELGEAAKAIVNMQTAVRTLVEQDTLTGLYNRRYGNIRFRKIQARSRDTGMPFSLAIGDIDFFKNVNDTYGHEAGDLVLQMVSYTMKEHMLGKGIAARWGGEEFMILFDGKGQKAGERELRQLSKKINALDIIYENQIIKVTMTFGIVDGTISEDYGEILREADKRLYYGKEHGRNRVVTELSEEGADDLSEEGVGDLAENLQSIVDDVLSKAQSMRDGEAVPEQEDGGGEKESARDKENIRGERTGAEPEEGGDREGAQDKGYISEAGYEEGNGAKKVSGNQDKPVEVVYGNQPEQIVDAMLRNMEKEADGEED